MLGKHLKISNVLGLHVKAWTHRFLFFGGIIAAFSTFAWCQKLAQNILLSLGQPWKEMHIYGNHFSSLLLHFHILLSCRALSSPAKCNRDTKGLKIWLQQYYLCSPWASIFGIENCEQEESFGWAKLITVRQTAEELVLLIISFFLQSMG